MHTVSIAITGLLYLQLAILVSYFQYVKELIFNVAFSAPFQKLSVFQTRIQIHQINVKNDPSNIQCWDSNSRPLKTTRPTRTSSFSADM